MRRSFLVINRPGATGILGNQIVAKASADSNMLLVAPSSYIAIVPHMHAQMPYDTLDDLVPIVQISTSAFVLASHPSVPTKTIPGLIALAARNSDRISYGSSGIGSLFHLAGELLAHRAQIKMLHVPYTGTAQALTNLLGGHIDLLFSGVMIVKPFADRGKLHIIASSGLKRDPLLPKVPTFDESGLRGYEIVGWQGIFGPRGMSQKTTEQLTKSVHSILTTPEITSLWRDLGVGFVPNTPLQFSEIVRRDYVRFGQLVKEVGVKSK